MSVDHAINMRGISNFHRAMVLAKNPLKKRKFGISSELIATLYIHRIWELKMPLWIEINKCDFIWIKLSF